MGRVKAHRNHRAHHGPLTPHNPGVPDRPHRGAPRGPLDTRYTKNPPRPEGGGRSNMAVVRQAIKSIRHGTRNQNHLHHVGSGVYHKNQTTGGGQGFRNNATTTGNPQHRGPRRNSGNAAIRRAGESKTPVEAPDRQVTALVRKMNKPRNVSRPLFGGPSDGRPITGRRRKPPIMRNPTPR